MGIVQIIVVISGALYVLMSKKTPSPVGAGPAAYCGNWEPGTRSWKTNDIERSSRIFIIRSPNWKGRIAGTGTVRI